jgi:hypothetical protein
MVPIAIIKNKQRWGLEPGSATQLSSMITTALRRTADKTTILQDINLQVRTRKIKSRIPKKR